MSGVWVCTPDRNDLVETRHSSSPQHCHNLMIMGSEDQGSMLGLGVYTDLHLQSMHMPSSSCLCA